MKITLFMSSLFFFGLLLLIPIMRRKPLTEDEGNWYYIPAFWDKGLRPLKNHFRHDFLSIPTWAALYYNCFSKRNVHRLQEFKAIWYAATAAAISYFAFSLWRDPFTALIAGSLFLFTCAQPSSFFSFSYGENFLLLPYALMQSAAVEAIRFDQPILAFVAGVVAMWAHHIKMTSVLLSFATLSLFIFADEPFRLMLPFILGAIILQGAVCILGLILYGKHFSLRAFLLASGRIYLIFLYRLLVRIKLDSAAQALARIRHPKMPWDQTINYFANLDKTRKQPPWETLRTMLVVNGEYAFILLLALSGIIYSSFEPSWQFILLLLIVSIEIIRIVAHGNYYFPHFNTLWLSICCLAAYFTSSTFNFLPVYNYKTISLTPFFIIPLIGLIRRTWNEYSWIGTERMGFLPLVLSEIWSTAAIIGDYIRTSSNPHDKLLVWGSQPSIYIYSQREMLDERFIFIYSCKKMVPDIEDLLTALRKQPPEYIVFFKYLHFDIDNWNSDALYNATGLKYDLVREFPIQGEFASRYIDPYTGKPKVFGVYRRNDQAWRELLLDRGDVAMREGQSDESRKWINRILEVFPEDYEAVLWESLLELEPEQRHEHLRATLAVEADNARRAVALRLLGDSELAMGRVPAAISRYEEARAANPEDERAMVKLGEQFYLHGRKAPAMRLFQEALKRRPEHADALVDLAVVLLNAGDTNTGKMLLDKALNIQPAHTEGLRTLASISRSVKQPSAAVVQN